MAYKYINSTSKPRLKLEIKAVMQTGWKGAQMGRGRMEACGQPWWGGRGEPAQGAT